eukprot:1160887-Pelagomonas_calceolata.AAC.2
MGPPFELKSNFLLIFRRRPFELVVDKRSASLSSAHPSAPSFLPSHLEQLVGAIRGAHAELLEQLGHKATEALESAGQAYLRAPYTYAAGVAALPVPGTSARDNQGCSHTCVLPALKETSGIVPIVQL